MQFCAIALTLFIGQLSQAHSTPDLYPTFSFCDETLISGIKALQFATGTPRNILKTMEEGERYTVAETSYAYKNTENKCITMDVADSTLNITFLKKDGGPPGKLVYKVREGSDGVLYGEPLDNNLPNHKWKWYTVYASKNVIINYVCSEVQGSQEPPLTVFWVAKKSFGNLFTSMVLRNFLNVLKGLGFKITSSYGSECIS